MNLSCKFREDHVYFENIKQKCFNKEVGEAFFALMLETDTEGFNAQAMPLTVNKLNAIAERLSTEYRFLKDRYIFENKGISQPLSDLYQEYQDYCLDNQYKTLTKIKFTTKLREVNIESVKSNGQFKYKITYDELKAVADKYHWIHELDEWNQTANTENNETDDKDDIINKQKKQIEELLAEVARLKAQLEDPLDNGIIKEDQRVVVVKSTKKQTPKKKVVILGENKSSSQEIQEIMDLFDD